MHFPLILTFLLFTCENSNPSKMSHDKHFLSCEVAFECLGFNFELAKQEDDPGTHLVDLFRGFEHKAVNY